MNRTSCPPLEINRASAAAAQSVRICATSTARPTSASHGSARSPERPGSTSALTRSTQNPALPAIIAACTSGLPSWRRKNLASWSVDRWRSATTPARIDHVAPFGFSPASCAAVASSQICQIFSTNMARTNQCVTPQATTSNVNVQGSKVDADWGHIQAFAASISNVPKGRSATGSSWP